MAGREESVLRLAMAAAGRAAAPATRAHPTPARSSRAKPGNRCGMESPRANARDGKRSCAPSGLILKAAIRSVVAELQQRSECPRSRERDPNLRTAGARTALCVRVHDAFEPRQEVELKPRATQPVNDVERVVLAQCSAVRTVVDQRVERFADPDDLCFQGNFVALEHARVAFAIDALVMASHPPCCGAKARDLAQD